MEIKKAATSLVTSPPPNQSSKNSSEFQENRSIIKGIIAKKRN